jgi:hypothetical protein
MSDDIYKILESLDSVKSGHKDQLKGTDKPSKGKPKYDGPYTKHPFQGKLVGEDATEEEEDLFHTELDDLVHKTFGPSSDEKKKMDEGRMKELTMDLESLTDEEFKDKYGADKSTFSSMVAKGNIDNYDIRKKPWKDSDAGAIRGSKENLVSDIHEEFEKFDNSEMMTEEQFDEAAGEKDACYHKVKSRYKVWPSAYASGALSKCRKVGAKNWGNKSKKQ